MAFGQQSGPPATARQVQHLLSLLEDAGHSDFRDARGPMGFTQRQAGGKFTRDEAETFIEQLEEAAHQGTTPPTAPPPTRPRAQPKTPQPRSPARSLREVPDELLAAELQRRGWIVVEP